MKPFIAAILSVLTVFCAVLISSCAQVAPLTGGDRDTTPPKIETESPGNGSVNFAGNTISIKFNEYIQVKDLTNQLIVTPQLKNQPDITASGKILTVKFDEKLKENTTYKLFFGNAITDITEGNPIANYEYTFSTGSYIDSLQLSGVLTDAYTREPVKDAWAFLYLDTNDSIIYKSKPDYLARSNARGEYLLKGLAAGKYKMIALLDKNKNYLYDNGEAIGFADSLLSIPQNDTVNVPMFIEKNNKVYIKRTDHFSPEKVLITFNTPPDSINTVVVYKPDGTELRDFDYRFSRFSDSAFFYFPEPKADSIYIKLVFNGDRMDSALVTFLSEKQLKDQFERKRFPMELGSVVRSNTPLPYNMNAYKLTSTFLVKATDKNKLILKENGETVDTSKIRIKTGNADSLYIYYKWKDESEYTLQLMKGFATDHYDRNNDSVQFAFKTNSKSDYGSLKIEVSGLSSGDYILQLMNTNNLVKYEKVFHVPGNGMQEVVFGDVLPDTYKLRVVSDANNDKGFTPGSYNRKKQAEDVYLSDQTIKIISDWDNELKWEIKK